MKSIRRTLQMASAAMSALMTCSQGRTQLAITEVMAQTVEASLTPDFWELTNFGDEPVNLIGYSIHDTQVHSSALPDVTIGAGETHVFVRSNRMDVASYDAFINWWQIEDPPPSTRLHFYFDPGFNENYDELWLVDASGAVIDMVQFARAAPGVAFVYDPDTGEFGARVVRQEGCAWQAPTGDTGSPFCTAGRIMLEILEQPLSHSVEGCGRATLLIRSRGMPRPKYQWFRNGEVLAGENGPVLNINKLSQTASYYVVLNNGLEELVSETAILTVFREPLAPTSIVPPEDVILFPGQTAWLSAEARGYPCPNYEWRINGSAFGTDTNTVSISAGGFGTNQITLQVSNEHGSIKLTNTLLVVSCPQLLVTEVMPWPTNIPGDLNTATENWFELTNVGTNVVDLKGYRFSDNPDTFVGSASINEHLFIRPGESIVFVEKMSRPQFLSWWGEHLFPPSIQVFTWRGWGLNTIDDGIYFWNKWETGVANFVTSTTYLSASGVSVNGPPELVACGDECFSCGSILVEDSREGEGGAFVAARGNNVGSPGLYDSPWLLRLETAGNQRTITGRGIQGRSYQLLYSPDLSNWSVVGMQVASGLTFTFTHRPESAPIGFYQLQETP